MNARNLFGGGRAAGFILSSFVLAGSVTAQQAIFQERSVSEEQAAPPAPTVAATEGEDPLLIETHINLGDDAFGILDAGGEIHRFTFEAVEGTELYIRGERQHGLMQLAFELRAPSGGVIVEPIESIKTPDVAKKKHIFLPETGTYTLEFQDLLDNGGTYTMRTIPNWKERHKGFVAVDGDSVPAPVIVDAVAGSTLRTLVVRTLKPKGNFEVINGQPNNLEPMPVVRTPTGEPVDFGTNVKVGKDGKKVRAWKVPLPEIGTYSIEVDGQEGTVGFANVLIKLRFPKGGELHNVND